MHILPFFNLIGPRLFFQVLLFSSMSFFYQVMGAARCPKIKKHAGIKLKPINKAKEPFTPGDMLLFSCESTESIQSIKCQDDGRWSDIPACPDPSNFNCPDLGPISHGSYNATKPFKVGTVVAFRCDNEQLPNYFTSLTSTSTTTSSPVTLLNQSSTSIADSAEQSFNLTGHRILKCLPSSKWNHPMPTCRLVIPEPESNIGFLLTSAFLILIPILILVAIFQLFIRWRKRQQQRERWKQYFTDYKYRHSKTSITFGLRQTQNNFPATIPVTDL